MVKRALTSYDTVCWPDRLSFAQEMRESQIYAGVNTRLPDTREQANTPPIDRVVSLKCITHWERREVRMSYLNRTYVSARSCSQAAPSRDISPLLIILLLLSSMVMVNR